MRVLLAIALLCFSLAGFVGNWDPAKEKFAEQLKLAEEGDARAQITVGEMYYYGEGVSPDFRESVKWYLKAAEQGNASAQYWVGLMYSYGEGIPKDYQEAGKWYLKAAEQGNVMAQYELGRVYLTGRGVTKNASESMKWFVKAAEQGDADAKQYVSTVGKSGEGVPLPGKEALKPDLRAFEPGSAENIPKHHRPSRREFANPPNLAIPLAVMGLLATGLYLYLLGKSARVESASVPITDELVRLVEPGDYDGQSLSSQRDRDEHGVPRHSVPRGGNTEDDKTFAEQLKLAESGSAAAQFATGAMYREAKGVQLDSREAMKWYLKSSEQGYPKAQNSIGWMYFKGEGVLRDDKKARYWFLKAAEQGFSTAQFNLGLLYASVHLDLLKENAQSASQNLVLAYMWISLAAMTDPIAENARRKVETILTPAQLEEGQRLRREWLAENGP